MASVQPLLNYIVTNYAVKDQQLDIDLNANAVEDGAELASEKQEVAQRERDRADALSSAFERGLVAAYRAQQSGSDELLLDDRDPDENAMADALIKFLVSYGLATSRSEETEPMHYQYGITVDWAKLNGVAEAAGISLAEALAA